MKINLKDYGITVAAMSDLKNYICKEEKMENPVIPKEQKKGTITLEKIKAKLRAGKKLTAQEMAFLRMYAPELYQLALKIQMERKGFEEQIKHCNSKEEVLLKLGFKLNNIPENEELREALMNVYQDVVREFQKTEEYRELPGNICEKEAAAKGEESILQQAYSFVIFWNGFQDRIESVL